MNTKIFKTRNSDKVRLRDESEVLSESAPKSLSENGSESLPENASKSSSEAAPPSALASEAAKAELVAGTTGMETGRSESSNAKKKVARYLLSNSKVISISMSIVLGVAGSIWLCSKNSDKELLVRKYSSYAELSEFDQKFVTASAQWHQAIKIAESMSDKRRLLADLHLRAAGAEWQASSDERYIESTRLHQMHHDKNIPSDLLDARVDYHVKPIDDAELEDLQKALAIYEKIPNTKADQIAIIDKLKPIFQKNIPEFNRVLPDDSYLFSSPNLTPSQKDEVARKNATQELLNKEPGLGVDRIKVYLRHTRNSHVLIGPILNFARSLSPDEIAVHKDLVPLLYEVIYYYQGGPRKIQTVNYLLDHSLGLIDPNSLSYESRLKEGDTSFDAHNYHAAIVEYHRCLGLKFDETVQQKLVRALQLCQEEEEQYYRKAISDYMALLVKSKALDLPAYGLDNPRTQQDISRLGITYAALNKFEEAEHELLLADSAHIANNQINEYNLADVFAKEGKAAMALERYQRGKSLEKGEGSSKTPGVWARMAFVCIRAGKLSEAEKYMKLAESERMVDSFGTNSFGIIHQPMME